jgi:hypothetical protein
MARRRRARRLGVFAASATPQGACLGRGNGVRTWPTGHKATLAPTVAPMTPTSLVLDLVERVWNAGDLDALDAYYAASFEHDGRASTVDELRAWHRDDKATWAGTAFSVIECVGSDDAVALLGQLYAQNPGDGRFAQWIANELTHRKFSIYFTAMPTFGYQRIESKTNDKIYIESIKKISAFSTERLGLRVELGAEVPLSNRLKVFGGILYYQRKQTIDYTEKQIDTTQVSIGSNGEYVVGTKLILSDKSFEYELKNIGFQVGLNYQLKKAKFLQSLGTGIEFQFALNKLSEEINQTLTNNPSAYVFYNLYYRLQYPSEGRLKAVFQPTLNYSFYINQDLNAPFYVKPYGLGLNVGATYNF